MNHFSYELMAKEKIKDCMEEGLRGQTVYRSSSPKRLVSSLSRLIFMLLGMLTIVEMLAR